MSQMIDDLRYLSKQMDVKNGQDNTSTASPPVSSESEDIAASSVAPAISSTDNLSATHQASEISGRDLMDITDQLSENDESNSWVIVKEKVPETITAEQIAAHRRSCVDFNCPACLPLNLAIKELKASKQKIDNILALLEMKRDDSD